MAGTLLTSTCSAVLVGALLVACCAAEPLQPFQCFSDAIAACPAAGRDQCSVLMDYKLTVKEEPDKDPSLSTWTEGSDCCSWKGITCKAAGNGKKYVTDVYLVGGSGTGGQLPASFSSLSRLTKVTINAVGLEGTIPAEWGNLTDLTQVSLWGNALTGSISSSWAKLKKLQFLLIEDNKLTGQLPSFPSLMSFDVSGNQLTGTIPASLDSATTVNFKNNAGLGGCVPQKMYNWDVVTLKNTLKQPGSYFEGTAVTGKC